MRSIRSDLTVRLLIGLGITIVALSAGSWVMVEQAVSEDFDAALATKAKALASLLTIDDDDGMELDLSEQAAHEFIDGPDPEFLQIWKEDGTVFAHSPSLQIHGAELPHRFAELDVPVFWDQPLPPEGRPGRAVGMLVVANAENEDDDDDDEPVARADAEKVVIVTARSRASLDGTLAGVATVFFLGGLATLLVIVVIVHSSVRRALEPVKQLSAHIDAIGVDTLSDRVDDTGVPRELDFIPPKLNALLQRLEQAFERERRMTSNVAHELRTPLAELRAATEVAQRWSDDEKLRTDALDTAHDVSLRMSGLVNSLLRLSRVASGQARLEEDRVEVASAVVEHWRRLATAAKAREQRLDLDVPDDLVVLTDRDLLDVAVGNLIGNAVQHGVRGSEIRCTAGRDNGHVRLTVANDAADVTDEDLAHLSEPFWQADAARSAHEGMGLGLALVDAVADALGAHLSFDLRDGRFSAHLDLPSSVTPA